MMPLKQLLMPFFVAWISGMIILPMVRRVALGLGLVDRPNSRKIHAKPIPRIGGLALYVACFLGALPFLISDHKTTGIMVASTFIFIVGLLDDILDLPARVKLGAQIVACVILFAYNVKIDFVTDFIAGKGLVDLGLLTYPLSLIWIIGLTNTVNLVDGVDGLAGGIVFIALSTLLAVRIIIPTTQDAAVISNVIIFCSALMGSLLAFLRFNVFPASIFMGDSGAYFLGFMTAALSVAGAAKGSIMLALIVPLIAFGLPVIDVILAILRRSSRRVPIFQADREHLHHKLLAMGFTQAETTRFLWMVSSCFGFLAILTADIHHRGLENIVAILLLIMVVACVIFFFRKLNEKRSAQL